MARGATIGAALLAGWLACMGPASAVAGRWELITGMRLKEEYNDNVYLLEQPLPGETITTMSADISAVRRDERTFFQMSGSLSAVGYSRSTGADSWDQEYRMSGSHSVTERLQLGGAAALIRDSRPDRDVESGGLVTSGLIRWQEQLSLNASYRNTPRTSSDLSYQLANQYYQGRETSDSLSHSVAVSVLHHLGWWLPNDTVSVEGNYGTTDYWTSTVASGQALAGYGFAIDELWRLSFGVGLDYSTTRFQEWRPAGLRTVPEFPFPVLVYALGDASSSELGWIARMLLDYHGEKVTASLQWGRDTYSSGEYGGLLSRDRILFRGERRLSEKATFSLLGEYIRFRSMDEDLVFAALDERTWRLGPGLRYRLGRDVDLAAEYAFTDRRNQVTGGESRQNKVSVTLSYDKDLLQ
ncbi:MAG: hypothetical protein AB1568_12385 [Thermodesulfobacteriota bacterium]